MENQDQLNTMNTEATKTPDVVAITFSYNPDFTYESVVAFAQQFPTYQTKGTAKEQKHAVVFQLVSYEIAKVATKMWQLVEDWDTSLLKINKEVVPMSTLLSCRDKLPKETPIPSSTDESAQVVTEHNEEPDWVVDPPGVIVGQIATPQQNIATSVSTQPASTQIESTPLSSNGVQETQAIAQQTATEATESEQAIAQQAVTQQIITQQPQSQVPEVTDETTFGQNIAASQISDVNGINNQAINEPVQNEPIQNEPIQNEPIQNEPIQIVAEDAASIARPESVPPVSVPKADPLTQATALQNPATIEAPITPSIDLTEATAFIPSTPVTSTPTASAEVITSNLNTSSNSDSSELIMESQNNETTSLPTQQHIENHQPSTTNEPTLEVVEDNVQIATLENNDATVDNSIMATDHTQQLINMNIAGEPQIPTQVSEITMPTAEVSAISAMPEVANETEASAIDSVINHADLEATQGETLLTTESAVQQPPQQAIFQEAVAQQEAEEQTNQNPQQPVQDSKQPENTSLDGIHPDAFAKPISTAPIQSTQAIAATQQVLNTAQAPQVLPDAQAIPTSGIDSMPDLTGFAESADQNLNGLINQASSASQTLIPNQASQISETEVSVGRYPTPSDKSESTEDFSFSEIKIGRFPGAGKASLPTVQSQAPQNQAPQVIQNQVLQNQATQNQTTQIHEEAQISDHNEIDIGIGELPASMQSIATQQATTAQTIPVGFNDDSDNGDYENLGLKTVIDESTAKPIWRKLLGGKS